MPSAYGISNCVGWYKAGIGVYSDAGSTPAGTGSGVAQWNDLSGAGHHLTQTTSANRPIYNPYTAVVSSSGAASVSPYGPANNLYQPSDWAGLLFDGSTTFLNMPSGLTMPTTGVTILAVTRGHGFSPVSFGTDGSTTFNMTFLGGSPGVFGVYNGSYHLMPDSTFLPTLRPSVWGLRSSPSPSETRMYFGTTQSTATPSHTFGSATAGGAVGRTLNTSQGGYGNFSFNGEIFELVIFAAALSDGDVSAVLAKMSAANRIRSDADGAQVVFVGDSLTAGGPGVMPTGRNYPAALVALTGGSFRPLMMAVSGATLSSQQSLVNSQVVSLNRTPFALSAAVVCCGSNDVTNGRAAADVQADLATMCGTLRTNGFKVIVVTYPGRSLSSGPAAVLATVNQYIRDNYGSFADQLVDWAGDPRLADPTDATYFTDGVHSTDAGDAVKAALVRPALDALMTPVVPNIPPLTFGKFYAGGRSFDASFGRFVR